MPQGTPESRLTDCENQIILLNQKINEQDKLIDSLKRDIAIIKEWKIAKEGI